MSWWKILLLAVGTMAVTGIMWGYYMWEYAETDIYVPLFADNCGECHGVDLKGTEKGLALIERHLEKGESVASLMQSIRQGNPSAGMPAFNDMLTDEEVKGLALYVAERRLGQRLAEFRFDDEIVVPADQYQSEEHDFVIELFADGLDPMVFSIEPLPDGSFLLTEKEKGLSIISAKGIQSDVIKGTPRTATFALDLRGVQMGVGWLLGVAAHPDYNENGWIYLHYTDLCPNGCTGDDSDSFFPVSMNRLDRGRIRDGDWVDVETLWQAQIDSYTSAPDTGAGGRIAFDNDEHVYISIGIKDLYGPQDLNNPFGKIHRIMYDGSIPPDNPFVITTTGSSEEIPFTRKTIWTYGHRSPQGLEWNYTRGRMWNSEMGPRGGDEINELLPGKNYGWPYHSLGLEYDGRTVERNKPLKIEFDVNTVEQTLVDISPSPAISSFAFYDNDKFVNWKDNILIGSLKGSSLFRMVFDGKKLVHTETLIKNLARIRDVEVGYDGLVYLLLEAREGSKIVRLVPIDERREVAGKN
jgi:aldose sugar dehydrogenase